MIICLILLLLNIGPSALAGFGLFLIGSPLQTRVMRQQFTIRKKSMVFTDKRAKLLQELLGNMRIIKFFAWEVSNIISHVVCVSAFIPESFSGKNFYTT